jgi:hypothetical protein
MSSHPDHIWDALAHTRERLGRLAPTRSAHRARGSDERAYVGGSMYSRFATMIVAAAVFASADARAAPLG